MQDGAERRAPPSGRCKRLSFSGTCRPLCVSFWRAVSVASLLLLICLSGSSFFSEPRRSLLGAGLSVFASASGPAGSVPSELSLAPSLDLRQAGRSFPVASLRSTSKQQRTATVARLSPRIGETDPAPSPPKSPLLSATPLAFAGPRPDLEANSAALEPKREKADEADAAGEEADAAGDEAGLLLDMPPDSPRLPSQYVIAGFAVRDSRVLPHELIARVEQELRARAAALPACQAAPTPQLPLSADQNAALVRAFAAVVNAWYLENGYLFARLHRRPRFVPMQKEHHGWNEGEGHSSQDAAPAFRVEFDCAEPLVANPPLKITFVRRETPQELDARGAETGKKARAGAGLVETTGKLREDVLAKHLNLRPGAPFKWDVLRWQRAAGESDLFEDAQANAAVLPGNEGIRVEVVALEKPSRTLRPGISFPSSAPRDVQGQLLLENRNIAGTSARGRLALRLSPKFDFSREKDKAKGSLAAVSQTSSFSADLLLNSLSLATDQESVRLSASASSTLESPPLVASPQPPGTQGSGSAPLRSRLFASLAAKNPPGPAASPASSPNSTDSSASLLLPAGHVRVSFSAAAEKRLGEAGSVWGEASVERRKGRYLHFAAPSEQASGLEAAPAAPGHADGGDRQGSVGPSAEPKAGWTDKVKQTLRQAQPLLSAATAAHPAVIGAEEVAALRPLSRLSVGGGSVFGDPTVGHDVAKVAGGVRLRLNSRPADSLRERPSSPSTSVAFEASSFAGVFTPYTVSDAAAAFSVSAAGAAPSGASAGAPSPPASQTSCLGYSWFPGWHAAASERQGGLSSALSSLSSSAFFSNLAERLHLKRLLHGSALSQHYLTLKNKVGPAVASFSSAAYTRARQAGGWVRDRAMTTVPFAPQLLPSGFSHAPASSLYRTSPPLPFCGLSASFASRTVPFLQKASPASDSAGGRGFCRRVRGCLGALASPFDLAHLSLCTRFHLDVLLPPRMLLAMLSSCVPAAAVSSPAAAAASAAQKGSLRVLCEHARNLSRSLLAKASCYVSSCRSALASAEELHKRAAAPGAMSSPLPHLAFASLPYASSAFSADAPHGAPLPSSSFSAFPPFPEDNAASRGGAAPDAKASAAAAFSALPSKEDRDRLRATSLRAAAARFPPWEMLKLKGEKGDRVRGWGREPVGLFEAVASGSLELRVPIVARARLGPAGPRVPVQLMELAFFLDHSLGFSPFLLHSSSPAPPSAAAAATAAAAAALGPSTAVGDGALGSGVLTDAAETASGPGGSRPLRFLAQARQRASQKRQELEGRLRGAMDSLREKTGWSACQYPSVGMAVRIAPFCITFAKPVRLGETGLSFLPGRFHIGMINDSF
ncbi:hypothetical protein BESB_032850 [Besnoitia besnoiti]|uniref:Transmembrane protein n=1 Tax=Besnoitia besnoiti TaxID=94643 RepID=A0A2A9LX73_BESBE|nr:uncharacterized protein BESB_032850 [Besnoitia besnoiti]PFH31088.1 hypothetical protein BESB_032850 [Besnoitia besnoiti]